MAKESKKLKLEIALQKGMEVKIVGDRVIIDIDTSITSRDLWTSQFELWLSEKDSADTISSGYLRVNNKDKLEYAKHKRG